MEVFKSSCSSCFFLERPLYDCVHPGKLTWILTMMVGKNILININMAILGIYVEYWGV